MGPSLVRGLWATLAALTVALALLLALTLALAGLGSAPALAAPATTVTRGPTDRPRIALTFDDNNQPARALAVIDVLERYKVPATMFVIGSGVTAYPGITRAIADGGFEVGDHSQSHAVLTKLSWTSLLREMGAGTAAFNRATGRRTAPLMRPPYGSTNGTVAAAAGEKGFLYVVLWDVDTNDWQGPVGRHHTRPRAQPCAQRRHRPHAPVGAPHRGGPPGHHHRPPQSGLRAGHRVGTAEREPALLGSGRRRPTWGAPSCGWSTPDT